ncbi:hypothetical protein AK812_SmicGene18407 [Symbiodinium microadriaticum]|uniref:Uncharacterized protein n=1 Tax=Symbiodinium microadriaticum TaxID=2951 RepID=A0A1Q9DV88_SYMMI|nr:hypothetical protein AK812_SmicGene18407 [Symbiodinium microadriaticum]
MSRRDRHALISEVIRGLEDSGFTSLKALQEMLERRLGISLSDRKREIRQYTEIVTDIAAGDLVKSPVFETSLRGQQICDVACKLHEDAGNCLDQQHVFFTGKRPEDCNVSSDYCIQPAVIEVLTAYLIELGLVKQH